MAAAATQPAPAVAAPSEQEQVEELDLSLALELDGPPCYYRKEDYVATSSGNKVSRQALCCGSQNISLAGKSIVKPDVVLRGDLQLLRIGKYVSIGEGCVLRPSYKKYRGSFAFFPMVVGDYVTIGDRSIISAAEIGSCVQIGEDCVISRRCFVKDGAVVLPGTVLPPDTVVPQLTCFGGTPGKYLGDLIESTRTMQRQSAVALYRRFQPQRPS